MSRISVRGIAVASATAVTTVGAVVGVASGSEPTAVQPVADAMALDSFSAGQQANTQAASLAEQSQSQLAAAEATRKQALAEAARKKAAADAAAKAAAAAKAKAAHDAQAAANLAAQRAQQALTSTNYSIAGIQAMAQAIIGNQTQYECFSWIVNNESSWNYQAVNPSTGAYGLVQALPGSKMSTAGADWRTNPATQIRWGLSYMNDRYGSPCQAEDFWKVNHWY